MVSGCAAALLFVRAVSFTVDKLLFELVFLILAKVARVVWALVVDEVGN